MDSIQQEYDEHKSWGLVASIDLYECNREFISSATKIKQLIDELCARIGMKQYGAPLIQRFAEGTLEGYSAMQFIETSSITMHFDETENRAFIDIFSCKCFEPSDAERFCKEFLAATSSKVKYFFRY